MPLFQRPPSTPAEVEAARPVDISVDVVSKMSEDEWYAQVYRGDSAPQLTLRAVAMGTTLGFFLAFTNVYVGLKTGWHLGVAITACVLSFTVWGTLHRAGLVKTPMTILENNCMQSTASSAGYSTGSTMVSAIPALLVLSATEANPGGTHLPVPVLMIWTALLAVLGVCLAIPMKRNLINRERLPFPSGLAAAATLQGFYASGEAAARKGKRLLIAGCVGMLFPPVIDLKLQWVQEKQADGTMKDVGKGIFDGRVDWLYDGGVFKVFDWLPARGSHVVDGKTVPYTYSEWLLGLEANPVMMAGGALVGLRVTLAMLVGAMIVVIVTGPIAHDYEWTNLTEKVVRGVKVPQTAWKEVGLWMGAPMLVASGLTTIAFQWRTVARAFTGLGGAKEGGGRDDVEVPTSWFLTGTGVAAIGIILVAWRFFDVPPHLGLLAVGMAFVLAMVAARATAETDVTPTGAMGKIVQLSYGFLMPQSATANLMTAGITAGSAAACADLLTDLKSGYLLGANPRRQFIAQSMGIIAGTVATVAGFYILVPDAIAITGTETQAPAFPAPSAQQWKAVAEVFRHGIGNLHPAHRTALYIGVVVGIVLSCLENLFPKAKPYIPSANGLGLGMTLPALTSLSMFIGAAASWLLQRQDKSAGEEWVVPVSSGLIAGISIMGIFVAAINNFAF